MARVRSLLVASVAIAALVTSGSGADAATANPWPHTVVNGFSTPTGEGFWLTYADGTVAASGDAQLFGDASNLPLNGPVVGGATVPDGAGYWLVADDGGIFSYGSAQFRGSMGGIPLNQPVFSMAPTATGNGYWLVAYDGGIFSFGDAQFYGSMGGIPLNQPVTGITTGPGGAGYRMVARDGGIFSFGSAPFFGSAVSIDPNLTDVVGMAATPSNMGYWIARANGTVYAFGDAPSFAAFQAPANNPVASIFANPVAPGYSLVLRDGTVVRRGVAPGGFASGVQVVGTDVPHGTYRNRDAGPCFWARLSGTTGSASEVIAAAFRAGPQVATIKATDVAFTATCTGWTPLSSAVTASTTAPFGAGTYVVGLDIDPGTWQNSGSTSRCYYERLSGFSAEAAETITSAVHDTTPVQVVVAPTDAGFYSDGCGTWTKVA